MCKKLLSGLFGGDKAPVATPATVRDDYSGGKEAEVRETSTAVAVGDRITGTGVNAGLTDKRKKGVPGLGL